jgi:transposase
MDEVYNNMDSILNEFYHLSSKKPRLMLYDITSVFFEGDNVEMAKRGYSRDKREDRPQVLLGLVLNEYGLPIHFEVMEGNVKDSTTVKKTVKKIKKRFNLKKGIFVGDRGMINSENVEAITGEGFGYIMALKHKTAKEFLEKKGIQAELFENRVPITIFVDGKEKQYVLCGSKHRKKRDLETLHEILKRGREALEEVKRMVEKGKIKAKEKVIKRAQKKLTKSNAEKYFDFKYDGRKFTIIEKENEIKKQKIFVDIISLKQRKLI